VGVGVAAEGDEREREREVEEEEEEDTPSIYSQEDDHSPRVDLAEFDIHHDPDMPLRLPLSLPTSPVDLDDADADAGFSMGLERLAVPALDIIPEREVEPAVPETPAAHMYSPPPGVTSYTSRYPYPQPPSSTNAQYTTNNNNPYYATPGNEMQSQQNFERVLRSRWSTSTLSTLRDDAGKKKELPLRPPSTSATSRLRLYFGSSSKKASVKRASSLSSTSSSTSSSSPPSAFATASSTSIVSSNSSSSNSSSSTVKGRRSMSSLRDQMSPMSPFFPFPIVEGPRSPNGYMLPSPTGKDFGAGARPRRESTESRRSGGGGVWGLRRSLSRSSMSTNGSGSGSGGSHTSECGSCESAGLRRKPIPVEMFIKC